MKRLIILIIAFCLVRACYTCKGSDKSKVASKQPDTVSDERAKYWSYEPEKKY